MLIHAATFLTLFMSSSQGMFMIAPVKHLASFMISSSLMLGSGDLNIVSNKMINLKPTEIATIVASDITDRQALITADFTRDIYSEKCTFQDEIDAQDRTGQDRTGKTVILCRDYSACEGGSVTMVVILTVTPSPPPWSLP